MKSIELFAGAGGLALGAEKASVYPVLLVEYDKSACATLRTNRPNWNVLEADITKLDIEALKASLKDTEIDIITGGCPCQAFSVIGSKRGLEDIRGTLFYSFAKFLEVFKPKAFIFENVKGLMSQDKGNTFKLICSVLRNEGYHIYYQVLNAKYYDVPQSRERLFIIGIRIDIPVIYEFPKKCSSEITIRKALKDVPQSEHIEYSDYMKFYFSMIPEGANYKVLSKEHKVNYLGGMMKWEKSGGNTGMLRRMSYDEVMCTVLTKPYGKLSDRCHPTETRPFTYRENARFQSFPDEWTFEGALSAKYRQIGNAVPVNLAYHVVKSVKDTISDI